jgi:hypothetical protein
VNAESVVEKTLASGLPDAFSQHLAALETKRNPVLFPEDSSAKQGHLRSKMSDGVLQSRVSSLTKGFEKPAPAWLAQAQPCIFSLIRVNPAHPVIRGLKLVYRTTRFHSSLAFLKLISRPKSRPVIAK